MLVTAPGVWAVLLLAWLMTSAVAEPLGEIDVDDFNYNLTPRKKGMHGHSHHNDTAGPGYKKIKTCRKLMCGSLPSKFKRHMKECALEMEIVLPVKKVCPPPFELRGTECFFVHQNKNETFDWWESRKRCKDMGADLAEPQDMVDFVNYIKENYSSCKSTIWLGATLKKGEANWKWQSGQAVPEDMWKPWKDNQPSGGKRCMEIQYWNQTDFYMNDWWCHKKGHYACEIEPLNHHEHHDHEDYPHHVSECGRPFRPNHPSQHGTMQLLSPYVAPALRKCILSKNGILNSWNNLVNRGVLMSMIYPSFLDPSYPELVVPMKEAIETTCPEPRDYEIHDFYNCVHQTCVNNIDL